MFLLRIKLQTDIFYSNPPFDQRGYFNIVLLDKDNKRVKSLYLTAGAEKSEGKRSRSHERT